VTLTTCALRVFARGCTLFLFSVTNLDHRCQRTDAQFLHVLTCTHTHTHLSTNASLCNYTYLYVGTYQIHRPSCHGWKWRQSRCFTLIFHTPPQPDNEVSSFKRMCCNVVGVPTQSSTDVRSLSSAFQINHLLCKQSFESRSYQQTNTRRKM
jgi:hypothetical protein